MSQRLLITIFSIGLVAAIGISSLISSSITSSMIASTAIAGPAGADGADGADGAKGEPGADGAPGGAGATGATGSGAPGAQGAVGPTGPDGLTGPPGVPGIPGASEPVAEPVVLTLSYGAELFPNNHSYTFTSIALDPGVYALDFTLGHAFLAFGPETYTEYVQCTFVVGTKSREAFTIVEGRPAQDFALSAVISTTTATNAAVVCTSNYYDPATYLYLNWSSGSLTALEVD